MKKELDEALCTKYPKIFRDRRAPKTETAMCWGFECGDGWYALIDNLCRMLMWDPKAGKDLDDPPVATQVKEKFGTLRFYVNGANDRQHHYIEFADLMSGSICEVCGTTKDVAQSQGWVRTRCLEHMEVRA